MAPTVRSPQHCTVLYSVLCTQVYCAKCHKLQFSASTTVLYSDPASIVALDGQGCPRCNGKVRGVYSDSISPNLSTCCYILLQVYTAEQIVEKGRVFHTGCFTCKKCKKPLKDKVEHRSPILRVLC